MTRGSELYGSSSSSFVTANFPFSHLDFVSREPNRSRLCVGIIRDFVSLIVASFSLVHPNLQAL
jgi:hypothetical protein